MESIRNQHQKAENGESVNDGRIQNDEAADASDAISDSEKPVQPPNSHFEHHRRRKQQRIDSKDRRILDRDYWIDQNGHLATYAGVFLFTLMLYFRPYELIPSLSDFSSMALVIAVATLLIYLPSQLSLEGNLTVWTTEVKCLLFMAIYALLIIPVSKDSGLAWVTLSDSFSKIVIIFVVMVNVLRTKARLSGLIWLSIGIGVFLGYQAIALSQEGVFTTEGYRVDVDFGGMFGNPNDMAIHLVIFTPIAIVLGLASRNSLTKLVYFAAAGIMVAGNVVTQSRGGFLGLIAVALVLVWKLGKGRHFKTILVSSIVGLSLILLAPGNYGTRLLSIFIPSLDPVGSFDERRELLVRSILVTLRNPFGIGMGNFSVVGVQNKVTHNAFTQISSELGLLAFTAYMIFLISPWRKLRIIERQTFLRANFSWIHLMSIGIQASIVGYMVSSFFGSVAYQWYIYYPVAYAVCLRRIYHSENAGITESERLLG